ncbi:uncharacterized protein F4812DRAFT_436340 [Daldinia caldariorum]|uniref:uncharacterized protein n=1 Tax=Daldinia caldariorum TaxID=326644 RepID=UPI002007D8B2|nr:uncharacterized protein F4812DRAFT_436340 [Daldinia caldariorum]KAI1466223.1 hypothetical protein F4812DRAFT_436340 [Daldinia caldariorum]
MVGLPPGRQHDATQSTPSQQIHLAWPNDYVSVGTDNQSVSVDLKDPYHENIDRFGQNEGPKEPIAFRPQVTVNVFNNNAPNTGAAGAKESKPKTAGPVNEKLAKETNKKIADLTAKLEALSKKVDELSSALESARGPRVECGLWNTGEVRSWKYPSNETRGRINFKKDFKSIPKVTTGMSSADVSKDANFRVSVYPTEIDQRGFKINVHGWSDTVIYSCGVSWVAIGE